MSELNDQFTFVNFILYAATLLFPILVPGPVASMLFVSIAKKRRLSFIHFCLLLIADGLSVFLIITYGLDDLICLTPFALFVSWRILFSSKELIRIGEEDPKNRRSIDVGIFSILFLQLLIIVIVEGIMNS